MVGVGVALGILAKLAVMILDTLLDLVPVVSRDSFRGDLYSIRNEEVRTHRSLLVRAGFLTEFTPLYQPPASRCRDASMEWQKATCSNAGILPHKMQAKDDIVLLTFARHVVR